MRRSIAGLIFTIALAPKALGTFPQSILIRAEHVIPQNCRAPLGAVSARRVP